MHNHGTDCHIYNLFGLSSRLRLFVYAFKVFMKDAVRLAVNTD